MAQAMGCFSPLSGVAIDSTNNRLYILDTQISRIVKVTASTGAFVGADGGAVHTATAWAKNAKPANGSTDGLYSGPTAIAVDTTHDLIYIADTGNTRIVKARASTGAFIGAIGNLSGTSTGTCPSSGAAPGWCTGGAFTWGSIDGGFKRPSGIAVDPTHDTLYVSDLDNSLIAKFTASTGAFIGTIGSLDGTSTRNLPDLWGCPGWCTGGQFTWDSIDGGFGSPYAIAVDPTHDVLYVTDYDNSLIAKFTASTGAFIGSIGYSTGTTGTCPPLGAAPGWCTGGSFTYHSGDGAFYGPYGVAIDPIHDRLYIADGDGSTIVKVTASTGAYIGAIGKTQSSTGTCPPSGAVSGWCTGGIFTWATGDGMFDQPSGVQVDAAGDALYISDQYNNRIVKVTASTGAFVGAIGNTTASTGTCPASGAAKNWCTGGTFIRGDSDGMFYEPEDLAVDPVHITLFIADLDNNRIQKAPK